MTETLDILNPKEAAAFLRLSPATLHKMKATGEVKYLKMGGRIFYRRSELLALVERSEQYNAADGDNPNYELDLEMEDDE
jgi:hypothetical protein